MKRNFIGSLILTLTIFSCDEENEKTDIILSKEMILFGRVFTADPDVIRAISGMMR